MSDSTVTHGLWGASAPPGPALSALAGDLDVDLAVIGGGYTGLSAALHAADQGANVVLLEAEDIGYGGAGRNVGLVNAGLWVFPDDLVTGLAAPYGERLLRQLGEAPTLVFDLIGKHEIACEAVRNGTLHCAVGERGLAEIEERGRQWRARGAAVEVLNADGAAQAIGGGRYAGALLDHRAGTIQPLAYARGLAAAAQGAGARLHTATPVTATEHVGARWRLYTPGGAVTASGVIAATDVYSHGPVTELAAEQVRLPYFNMATAPLPPDVLRGILPQRQGAWDTRQILSSFRLDAAGRLIFGSVGALRGPGSAIHRHWAERQLGRLFPALRGQRFEHFWYGSIGMTDDALPRLHRRGATWFSISGYNGRGIAPGTTFGRDLAGLALGTLAITDLSLPLSNTARAPFRGLREAFYEAGAQVAHFPGAPT